MSRHYHPDCDECVKDMMEAVKPSAGSERCHPMKDGWGPLKTCVKCPQALLWWWTHCHMCGAKQPDNNPPSVDRCPMCGSMARTQIFCSVRHDKGPYNLAHVMQLPECRPCVHPWHSAPESGKCAEPECGQPEGHGVHDPAEGSHPFVESGKEGETPVMPLSGKPYCPDPNAHYLCCYCNKTVRLRDVDSVVDSYQNVCHYECFMKEVAPNVRYSAGKENL